ncbi:hypothetical protein BV25DRAFT_1922601 [Artomyces pyxidatus]|uniref:Uncharacterized protein n=1 Tax=Artomyces pyxidatus TaxID=48021 RepID=A0ACB8SDC3_9AGAM|nr:hypothetical protein BV25DRAFT_1922601 [Artomyces pyxidatus]
MDRPRLLPGHEPGNYVVYLARPGTFEFALIPPGAVYHGPLRITIVNVVADVVTPQALPLLQSNDLGAGAYDSSSQTSSPVPTSQPDLDLELPLLHGLPVKPLMTTSSIGSPAASSDASLPPVCVLSPAIQKDPPPGGQIEREAASWLDGDAGGSSLGVSQFLGALQEVFADPVLREAALKDFETAEVSMSPLVDFLAMDMETASTPGPPEPAPVGGGVLFDVSKPRAHEVTAYIDEIKEAEGV